MYSHYALIQEFHRFLGIARQLHQRYAAKNPAFSCLPKMADGILELESILPDMEAAAEREDEAGIDLHGDRFLAASRTFLDAASPKWRETTESACIPGRLERAMEGASR